MPYLDISKNVEYFLIYRKEEWKEGRKGGKKGSERGKMEEREDKIKEVSF